MNASIFSQFIEISYDFESINKKYWCGYYSVNISHPIYKKVHNFKKSSLQWQVCYWRSLFWRRRIFSPSSIRSHYQSSAASLQSAYWQAASIRVPYPWSSYSNSWWQCRDSAIPLTCSAAVASLQRFGSHLHSCRFRLTFFHCIARLSMLEPPLTPL